MTYVSVNAKGASLDVGWAGLVTDAVCCRIASTSSSQQARGRLWPMP